MSIHADLKRVLELYPGYLDAQELLESVEGGGPSRFKWPGDDEIGIEGGADDDGPLELEEESDSEDFKHVGNGNPCRSYNHDGCPRGQACALSHAPDARSVRDELYVASTLIPSYTNTRGVFPPPHVQRSERLRLLAPRRMPLLR